MHSDDAPPNFWQALGEATALVDGVELESTVPTRFFQTLDPYPPEWGRLVWRIQLNRFVDGRAESPVFRTFYPGVEWNLRRPELQAPNDRWFLTAWMRWEGAGPHCDPAAQPAVHVAENTAFFLVGLHVGQSVFLRSRVDARDRRQIAQALGSETEPSTASGDGIILLDDLIERHERPRNQIGTRTDA